MMVNQTLPVIGARIEAERFAHSVLRGFILLTLACAVVVPHSFQLVEGLLIAITGLLSLVVIQRDAWLNRILLSYFLGVIVTAFYIGVGYVNGAPRAASNQTLFVYIVSPLLWILISTAAFQLFGLQRIVRLLIRLSWLAVLSVAAFFYLFLTVGRQAVQFLTEDANVDVSNGFAGATILVYGSLIFLAGGLFAQPMLIANRFARLILPGALVIAALTSGRSALILAVPVGLVVGAFLRSRMSTGPRGKRSSILLPTLLLGIGAVGAILLIDKVFDQIDLTVIFGQFLDEVASGGGSVRTEQSYALWEGFLGTYGLGAGHGMGVDYIRNDLYPWRYEVIPLATLYRVGVIGSLAYVSTFAVYGVELLRRLTRKSLTAEDIYMTGGFVAVALAVATNPYIEGFVFQWMYLLPVMSLGVVPIVREAMPVSEAARTSRADPSPAA